MSMLQSTLKAQKRALRNAIVQNLAAIAPQKVQEQTHGIVNRLASFPAFQHAESLSCYLSMPSGEVDTTSLVSEVLKSGRTLFVPKIVNKSGQMDFLKLYGMDDLASLPSGVWGIKEPDFNWQGEPRLKALETPELDLILLPAVAFDKSFARLGHGKGYYDRFITTYYTTFQRRPLLVGLALREQILEKGNIPMDQHDWSMDYIVTPDEVLVNPTSRGAPQPQSPPLNAPL
ncbi:5-formyltetrahydrofolate cyclo-ligase [Macrolepiota fuliginosa MF-IS2]|uniref:5-formyltetrahydrofolate cyclo-ligase n=1 Tax=Macrolepiota fuliginosa MF-IS2 TaxID=1400762 RepID=A0A9P6C4Z5_9AGAR|nr:5-formyltetrahydrofolate cyclo-ligase [Macrolepiota fuliginosa MF-IS2]